MEIDKVVLEEAVARGAITPVQAAALLEAAGRRRAAAAAAPHDTPLWRPLTGALGLALGTGLTLAAAFDRFGFPGLAAVASALAVALLAAGWQRFRRTGGTRGQVLLCGAVVVVPLAAHGVARAVGLGHPFDGGPGTLLDWLTGPWFPVQASAALASVLALRAFRIPFLVAPLAAAAWFAAQDAVPVVFGRDPSWTQRALVSALSGLVILAAGLAVDRRTRGDLAFWLYLPGLLAFGGGLVTWTGASAATLVVFALLNAGLVLASLLLSRRGFAVAGALGLAAAAGRLADDLLDPAALSFAMAALALALVGLGLLYHLQQARLAALLVARLPAALVRWLPPGRRSA
jgi:hypothetical protein